jgi:hypothetical protein
VSNHPPERNGTGTQTTPTLTAAVRPALAVIDPHALGTVEEWTAHLDLGQTTLLREIRRRRLRASRRAGKYWLTGQWIMDWVAGGDVTWRRPATTGAGGDSANGKRGGRNGTVETGRG